jgi:hypothetical protein
MSIETDTNASNTTKSLTKMIKSELYNEVKSLRVIIAQYKETEGQIETYKKGMVERTDYIQDLQNSIELHKTELNDFYGCFDKNELDKLALEKGDVLEQKDYIKYLNRYFHKYEHDLYLKEQKNNKLEYENTQLQGELVDVLNKPCHKCANSTNEKDIKLQIFDDIFKLYKDKISRFEEVEIENKKLRNLFIAMSETLKQIDSVDNISGIDINI